MDKDTVHISNGILFSKRNETGSFVETWMGPETVIQSEVRKRKKNHILTHIRGIQKNGTDEPGKAEDTDIENKDGHKRGKVGWDELGDWD